MKVRRAIKAVAFASVFAVTTSAAVACGGEETTDGGLTPITFQTFPGTVQTIPIKVAQEQGFFKENGLEVSNVDGTNGPAMAAAVAAGQVDVTGLPMFLGMQSIASGAKLKAVVGLSGGGGSVVFVSDRIPQSDSSYPESAEGLDGKTAAIAATGGYSERLLRRYVESAGVSLEYVTLPGFSAQVAATKAGQIDVMNFDLVTAYGLTKKGVGHVLWDFQETGPDEIRGATTTEAWVSDKFLAENPTAAKAFARSIVQADAWIEDPANRDAVSGYFSELAGTEVSGKDLDPMVKIMNPVVSAHDVEIYRGFFDEGTEPPKADAVLAPIAPQDDAAVAELVEEK